MISLEMLAQGSNMLKKANRELEIIRQGTKIKQEYCVVTV